MSKERAPVIDLYWKIRTRWAAAFDWLELNSRWNRLKALGSSNLVRASVLMPAFGYMLLLNDQVHQYLTIKYDGWLLKYLPNVWRIWLLFYGSFFLAIATILYSAVCPRVIKLYSSGYAMADTEARHELNMNQALIVQHRVREIYLSMPRWMLPYFDMDGMNTDVDARHYADPEGYLSKFLLLEWAMRDVWHRGLRIFLLLLYAIGLALIGIPAAFTFLQVTWIPINEFFR
jgi:hypothetical protein